MYAEDEAMKQNPETQQQAIFAMGCFWCGAAAFTDPDTNEKFPGILDVRAGYTGGVSNNPTYPAHEGHQEAVEVVSPMSNVSAYWPHAVWLLDCIRQRIGRRQFTGGKRHEMQNHPRALVERRGGLVSHNVSEPFVTKEPHPLCNRPTLQEQAPQFKNI